MLLVDSGHVSLKDIKVEGTKIEANANRYRFVGGNPFKTNKEKMAVDWRDYGIMQNAWQPKN